MTKIAGSGSSSQRHGSADPDPPRNVMDPQHCPEVNQKVAEMSYLVSEFAGCDSGSVTSSTAVLKVISTIT